MVRFLPEESGRLPDPVTHSFGQSVRLPLQGLSLPETDSVHAGEDVSKSGQNLTGKTFFQSLQKLGGGQGGMEIRIHAQEESAEDFRKPVCNLSPGPFS
jgi:hypothetical protein